MEYIIEFILALFWGPEALKNGRKKVVQQRKKTASIKIKKARFTARLFLFRSL